MGIVSQSKAQNKIVILDSCFSGAIGNHTEMPNYSLLKDGTTILAACGENEYATEENGHGVFTSLLVEALYGGAMNLLGEVSLVAFTLILIARLALGNNALFSKQILKALSPLGKMCRLFKLQS